MNDELRALLRQAYGTLDPALLNAPLYMPRLRDYRVRPEEAGSHMARTLTGWIIGDPLEILHKLPHHGASRRR